MRLDDYLKLIESGTGLQTSEMQEAITLMMDGEVEESTMASFLLALKSKGETVDEVVGAAKAMRSRMSPIPSNRNPLVDTCGTGGDGSGTFNISTASAIVAAAAGVSIAKHGNRAVSSKSGSADALRELGVNVEATIDQVEGCLDKAGICFCFAPLFHGSVRNVAGARKSLGVPTIFNMLGPLCNPAGAQRQIIGVGKPGQRTLIAQAAQKLGTEKTIVIHGTDGICEISNAAISNISLVTPDSIEETAWNPADFGLETSTREGLLASSPVESANLIRGVLNGARGAARDIVVANAAAAIWLVDSNKTLKECSELAQQQIDNEKAAEKLEELKSLSFA